MLVVDVAGPKFMAFSYNGDLLDDADPSIYFERSDEFAQHKNKHRYSQAGMVLAVFLLITTMILRFRQ